MRMYHAGVLLQSHLDLGWTTQHVTLLVAHKTG